MSTFSGWGVTCTFFFLFTFNLFAFNFSFVGIWKDPQEFVNLIESKLSPKKEGKEIMANQQDEAANQFLLKS